MPPRQGSRQDQLGQPRRQSRRLQGDQTTHFQLDARMNPEEVIEGGPAANVGSAASDERRSHRTSTAGSIGRRSAPRSPTGSRSPTGGLSTADLLLQLTAVIECNCNNVKQELREEFNTRFASLEARIDVFCSVHCFIYWLGWQPK